MAVQIPVVALYAPLNALFNIFLANRVSSGRAKAKVGIGTGQDKELELRVRMHGNNAEFVPLALLMLLIAELAGGAAMWLHVLGGTLLVARLFHAFGLPRPAPNVFRFTGTAATWLIIVATSVWTLVLRFAS